MNITLKAAMLAAVLCSGTPAALAAEPVSESRSVDARTVNINLDGVISLKVKQGPVATLTLYGKPEALKKVTVLQSGDQLRIDTGKGDYVDLHLNGAGRIEMIGQTKQLNATLGGVGSVSWQ